MRARRRAYGIDSHTLTSVLTADGIFKQDSRTQASCDVCFDVLAEERRSRETAGVPKFNGVRRKRYATCTAS